MRAVRTLMVSLSLATGSFWHLPVLADMPSLHRLSGSDVQSLRKSIEIQAPGYTPWRILPTASLTVSQDGDEMLAASTVAYPEAVSDRLCRVELFLLTRPRSTEEAWSFANGVYMYAAVRPDRQTKCDELDFQQDYVATPVPIEDYKLVQLIDFARDPTTLKAEFEEIDFAGDGSADVVLREGVLESVSIGLSSQSMRMHYRITKAVEDRVVILVLSDGTNGLKLVDVEVPIR